MLVTILYMYAYSLNLVNIYVFDKKDWVGTLVLKELQYGKS